MTVVSGQIRRNARAAVLQNPRQAVGKRAHAKDHETGGGISGVRFGHSDLARQSVAEAGIKFNAGKSEGAETGQTVSRVAAVFKPPTGYAFSGSGT